jgi:hypothetical protein
MFQDEIRLVLETVLHDSHQNEMEKEALGGQLNPKRQLHKFIAVKYTKG